MYYILHTALYVLHIAYYISARLKAVFRRPKDLAGALRVDAVAPLARA